MKAHPCADSAMFINHDEHTWTLSLIPAFVQADLALLVVVYNQLRVIWSLEIYFVAKHFNSHLRINGVRYTLINCRGGDDTQRGHSAVSPLESPDAAASNVILHSTQYLRRNSTERASMPYIALTGIHASNTWILCFTPAFEEADLALFDIVVAHN